MAYPLPLRKAEVVASRGVVASNHPLASAAGIEMLGRGGNAIDAAVATLFALTVVEPMMVSIFGGGFFTIRTADGTVTTLDNFAQCPAAATETLFTPVPGSTDFAAVGDENRIGHKAVGVPGTLAGAAEALARFGRLPLATMLAPAIRYAAEGFPASPYLVNAITDNAPNLSPLSRQCIRVPAGWHTTEPGATITARGLRGNAARGRHEWPGRALSWPDR